MLDRGKTEKRMNNSTGSKIFNLQLYTNQNTVVLHGTIHQIHLVSV